MPPIGDHAWVTILCSAPNACTSGCWKEGVALDLVHGGHDRGALEQREVLDHAVADGDRSHLAVAEEVLGLEDIEAAGA